MKKHLMPVALATSILTQQFIPLMPLTAEASTKTGIVQLWQEIPSGQAMPKGLTEDELKDKLYCRLNHTLSPATTSQNYNTYVNSCYVDDVLYLGESGDQFKVYISGYEGWVNKKKASKIKLSFNVNKDEEIVPEGTAGSDLKTYEYTVYTTARFLETTDQSNYSLARQSETTEKDYVKYEGDYIKSPQTFEESFARTTQGDVKSPSYYANEKGQLVHYISENVTKSNAYTKTIIGLAPSWMSSNKPYYSYDGIYFYTSLADVTATGLNAVNENDPYYNYYQYVSTRSKSRLDGADLDAYTTSKGYTSVPSGSHLKSNESQLVGEGLSFETSQKTYSVNQSIQYAMAIHESAFGRSSLSVKKNNLFGMNAIDANPTDASSAFHTVKEGVLYHADAYLSKGYSDALEDSRYYGAHLGNKGSGMNVKYSSDPYWGEKIAGIYHQLDKSNHYQDLNYYQLGIIEDKATVSIYQSPSSTSSVLYQVRNNQTKENFKHSPLLIVGEVGDFYQVKTETPINANGNPQFDATYDWNQSTGYVLKSEIDHIVDGSYTQGDSIDSSMKSQSATSSLTKTTTKVVAQGKVLTDSLRVRSGKGSSYNTLGSVKKGQTLSILEIGDEWHKIQYNDRAGYVSAEYIEVSKTSTNNNNDDNNDTTSSENSNTSVIVGTVTTNDLKVRTGAGTSHSIIGKLKKGETVEIVEKGGSWHRIKYGTGYGYVSADYVQVNLLTVTPDQDEEPVQTKTPKIQFKGDLKVEIGTDIDLLKDVSVINVGNDGYILDATSSNLDFSQTGTYEIEYIARYGKDFSKELTEKRKVIVQDTQAPNLTLKGDSVITLSIGDKYKELGVSVVDNSGEVIKYKITGSQFDTSVQGVYRLTYTATDSSGNSNSITREVRVQDPKAPILTLNGETYMVLRGGEAYIEPGYRAVDGNGNELKVAVIGAHFDYTINGQYTIEYIAENAEGIKAIATRVVVVKDANDPVVAEDEFIGTIQSMISNLNVRSGSGSSHSVIGQLGLSETAKVYSFKDDWYHIDFNGTDGYVHQEYVTFTAGGSTSDIELPVTPDTEISLTPEIDAPSTDDSSTDDSSTQSEIELPTEDLEKETSGISLITLLSIGLGVSITVVLVISGTLLYRHKRAKQVNNDPNIYRSEVESDPFGYHQTDFNLNSFGTNPLDNDDDNDSSFPHYF